MAPRFFQPTPSSMAPQNAASSINTRTPSRGNATTPRAQSPQESFFTTPTYGYPSPQSMSPGSPMSRPLSFSPHLRHLSPAPSSGVSSPKSMSEHESSDEEILSPLSQNLKVHLPDPESESEDEHSNEDIDVIDIDSVDPTCIPIDLKSDTRSLFSESFFAVPLSQQLKQSTTITIEELPALPLSPALSRTHSTGSTISNVSLGNSSHVSWQDAGIEIIQGEYSSCASSSDLDTTDDPQTEDDEIDDFEWNVDVCSSSYPTDDFLLGGILGLSTGSDLGFGMGLPKPMDRSFSISNRPATPFSPRKTRSYSTASATSLFTQEKNNASRDNTLKRRSLDTSNSKKRRRIISLFDDDGEGDDESDEAESPSPAKRVKGRMTIDSVLNGNKNKIRRGSLSQMFGLAMTEDMDVDM
ncbi:hypothetical protein H072_138 [Dactylellina haptotyla CBS 200.50]|uniref:Uncharacterized protein n=1 Tax=Dactylellina haptotyla (strain CBS 200.50) TaxID=1284197 RepID=S8AY28_DACHA|nr:hypothetical protein H072_138 [Dactylellina haptotyla CBS 200.50]